MAKSKKNQKGLIINIIIIALAVLTVCTLFFNVFKVTGTLLGKETVETIKGTDVFTVAFAGETPEGNASMLYALKTAEETAFVTKVFCWSYMLTVLVSLGTLVFAILNILGMKFKLINTILGIALVVLAIVAFIFAIVVAGKFALDVLGLGLAKTEGAIAFGSILMFAALIAGGAQVYKART